MDDAVVIKAKDARQAEQHLLIAIDALLDEAKTVCYSKGGAGNIQRLEDLARDAATLAEGVGVLQRWSRS